MIQIILCALVAVLLALVVFVVGLAVAISFIVDFDKTKQEGNQNESQLLRSKSFRR